MYQKQNNSINFKFFLKHSLLKNYYPYGQLFFKKENYIKKQLKLLESYAIFDI